MEREISGIAKKLIETNFNICIKNFEFQSTRKDFEGDITLLLFPILKQVKISPNELGELLGLKLKLELDLIKDYNVKKIYPNQLKIYLEPAKAISVVKHFDKLVVLGNNGKIIDLENLPINVPKVTGTNNMKKVFKTLIMIDKSNFDLENIKKIEFFQSERIDIEFKNKKKIRFPINYTVDNLNFALKLFNDDKYSKSKILDLRIPKRVITYD